MAELARTRLVAASAVYETDPVGGPPQGRYLNAAALLATHLAPEDLLAALRRIEDAAGRRRDVVDGPRTLDLDLLLHGATRVASATLELPHPRFASRVFALAPAADVAPAEVIPGDGRTVAAALAARRAAGEGADVVRVAEPEEWA